MPDSKITALTALTAADPAVDMFPVVDVSDTTMAASGTTKRISINNILACSPAATLASLNVTGSSIPANGLYLPTTNTLEFAANSLAQYRIAPLGVFSWYDGAGGTRMTLNSTGLGVGRSPSYRLQASSGTKATTASLATVVGITTTDADDFGIYFRLKTDATGANRYAAITSFDNGSGNGARDLVLQDLGGNVGISRASTGNKLEAPGVGVDGRGTVTGVSTVATTIYTIKQSATAAMCVVFGDDGSNGFCDIVLFLATVAPKVVSSQTLYGSPAARTYSASTTNLQLALASGTLSIRTAALSTLNT